MKAAFDVPDALYRQVKARAALDGRTIRDSTVELHAATALRHEAALITLDLELATRAAAVVEVHLLTGWLARERA